MARPEPAAPVAAPPFAPRVERRARPRNRELYIDAFRGLMALVMVQGHVFDSLLSPVLRAHPLYQFQAMFHGSTAPGFLFASGFVAGLPRSPLSQRATVRRARRLLFVLGVGYFLDLPYFSLWKIVHSASPGERAALFEVNPLQLIAVTQLALLGLQWIAGRHWVALSGVAAAAILAATPAVWQSRLSDRLPVWLGAYLDMNVAPSQFPIFPFSAFVFAGAAAGAALGRQDPQRRHRRALVLGLGLLGLGTVLAFVLRGRVDFWSVSPAYSVLRLGGLLLLLLIVEQATARRLPGAVPLALLGHETLLVYVLHLMLLFGGIVWDPPLLYLHGTLGLGGACAVLIGMVPVLYAAARLWHSFKSRSPHEATLILAFLSTWFLWEFVTRPW